MARRASYHDRKNELGLAKVPLGVTDLNSHLRLVLNFDLPMSLQESCSELSL